MERKGLVEIYDIFSKISSKKGLFKSDTGSSIEEFQRLRESQDPQTGYLLMCSLFLLEVLQFYNLVTVLL